MKGLSFKIGCAFGVLMLGSAVYASQYQAITVDARDGFPDLTYDGSVLTYDSDDSTGGWNMLTLAQNTGVLPDLASDVHIFITTTFHDYGVKLPDPARAYFTGGLLDLTFKYNGQAKQLRGNLTEGSLRILNATADTATLSGVFLFDTHGSQGLVNLPDSNYWPAPGLSSAVALTLIIGADLRSLQEHPELWSQALPAGDISDTTFTMEPNPTPIPEPASCVLLALGAFALIRRR